MTPSPGAPQRQPSASPRSPRGEAGGSPEPLWLAVLGTTLVAWSPILVLWFAALAAGGVR